MWHVHVHGSVSGNDRSLHSDCKPDHHALPNACCKAPQHCLNISKLLIIHDTKLRTAFLLPRSSFPHLFVSFPTSLDYSPAPTLSLSSAQISQSLRLSEAHGRLQQFQHLGTNAWFQWRFDFITLHQWIDLLSFRTFSEAEIRTFSGLVNGLIQDHFFEKLYCFLTLDSM